MVDNKFVECVEGHSATNYQVTKVNFECVTLFSYGFWL